MSRTSSSTDNSGADRASALRSLPAVDEILRQPAMLALHEAHSHQQILGWVRQAVAQTRQSILDGQCPAADTVMPTIVDSVDQLVRDESRRRLQPVINATGVLLHTNLGRSPLAAKAVSRMSEVASYTNLELDLASGKRSRRGERACELVAKLAGAEAAVVVNNCAASTILVLQAIAAGREVIISRGQLVEIGGGFRLPEVFESAGVTLREIGTTNRTYLRDYEQALGEHTGAIIRVHRSNFSQSGFVTEPDTGELVCLTRPADVPVIDDLGSGLVTDLTSVGIHEPTVQDSLRSGADLCLFSGDKLFGGPQCGIIVGKTPWIERIRKHPLMRALRTDKLTLAALEATAEIHLSGKAFDELPLFRMLASSADVVRSRCEAIVAKFGADSATRISVEACVSQIGGGSLPGVEVPSFAICLAPESSETLANALRHGNPAVLARQSDSQVILDLRTVAEEQLDSLVSRIRESLELVRPE